MKEKENKFNSQFNKLQGELLLIKKKNQELQTYIKSYGNMNILNNIENKSTEEIKKLNKTLSNNNKDNEKINNNIVKDDEISINVKKKIISTKNHLKELDLIYPDKYKENKEME